ncbi:hypothetical protein K1T71_007363 [Dendrolimus kikuchii]|uniref:Uncharacterized protein n=1 Tax=Dendrolimus kikuchii TaxID=765133 RepID=A0ACC1D0V2_9NEOP|nr:hypothetical protein K1T71_007363 [Dendrolimus kikuchii]
MNFFTFFIVMTVVITMVASKAPVADTHTDQYDPNETTKGTFSLLPMVQPVVSNDPVQPGTTGQSETPGTSISGYYPGMPGRPAVPGCLSPGVCASMLG